MTAARSSHIDIGPCRNSMAWYASELVSDISLSLSIPSDAIP